MGIGKIWNKTKEIKAEADSGAKKEKVAKEVEKHGGGGYKVQ